MNIHKLLFNLWLWIQPAHFYYYFFPLPSSLQRHVFKRLKFLGNKTLSHVATLFFLSIWHGLHSGYILCFSMEFFIITVERQVSYRVQSWDWVTRAARFTQKVVIVLCIN